MLLSELISCWQRPQSEELLLESAFLITQKHCNNLKQEYWQHKFANDAEEVYFFKIIHPQFAGRLMYYSIVYESVMSCPTCDDAASAFWLKELDRYDRFCVRHENIISYLSQQRTDEDKRYFMRNTGDRLQYVYEKAQFMCVEETTVWSTSAATFFAEKSYHQYVTAKVASQAYTMEMKA